ncbi:hypothetical protein ECDEC6D_1862 [Escherichia coli DEC6D]|nr:hypothetical protein ECDEC6D_1862 [Escherichia coli DEC6D]
MRKLMIKKVRRNLTATPVMTSLQAMMVVMKNAQIWQKRNGLVVPDFCHLQMLFLSVTPTPSDTVDIQGLPPQVQAVVLDLWVNLLDVPQKQEFVERIRAALGTPKSPDEMTPEEQQAAQQQQAQEQQQQELQMREMAGRVAKLEAEAARAQAAAQRDNAGAQRDVAAAQGQRYVDALNQAHTAEIITGIPEAVYVLTQDDDTPVPLEDAYVNPLVDWMLFRAFSKDAAGGAESGLAAQHYQSFVEQLGIKQGADSALSARKKVFNGG